MSWRAGLARGTTGILAVVLMIAMLNSPKASATSPIEQGSPTSGTTLASQSASYVATLTAVSGTYSSPLNFTTSTQGFTIVNGDELESTGPLSVADSPYQITGADTDASNDAGLWSFSLAVTADTIVQGTPTSDTTSVAGSASYSTTLVSASGFVGPVTFLTSTPGFTIANGDELKTTGALNANDSPYTITGTDSDAYGDAGTWTFSLIVTVGTTTDIGQTSPNSGSVTTANSSTFTSTITVQNNIGLVTFVTTKSIPGVTVSSSGAVSTAGPLSIGTYSVSGTDSDPHGDTGTWSFTLNVVGVIETVTFDGNGGSGVMAPESKNEPTSLSLNVFSWANHTFVDWNTSPDGSGVSFANGALFPFAGATTLYAQWRAGRIPSHVVTFLANGGVGSMGKEIDNTPTAISLNQFTRNGYTFVDWNTAANGSGQSIKAGDTYSFSHSITLFAQWKLSPKPVFTVTFLANGGVGLMAVERRSGPAPLTSEHFSRNGFTFARWNTAPNGSGDSYANGGTYPFSASATLYAQWTKKVAIAPPPIKASDTSIGPFGHGTATLSPALESLIQDLASQAKSKTDIQIALLGYGDLLSAAQERNGSLAAANVQLGRMRAQAVATYLEGQLSALGLKGWTISISAASLGSASSGQFDAAFVIVTLS